MSSPYACMSHCHAGAQAGAGGAAGGGRRGLRDAAAPRVRQAPAQERRAPAGGGAHLRCVDRSASWAFLLAWDPRLGAPSALLAFGGRGEHAGQHGGGSMAVAAVQPSRWQWVPCGLERASGLSTLSRLRAAACSAPLLSFPRPLACFPPAAANLKALLKQAVVHYHPDRQARHGKKW